jgi:hypothetical protein
MLLVESYHVSSRISSHQTMQLMSIKLQWMYKEVQVIMINLRYHPGIYLEAEKTHKTLTQAGSE